MKMKKFINAPETITDEELVGLGLAYPDILDVDGHLVISKDLADADRVTIVTYGGSGHEPAQAGFVGKGMLDVQAVGDIFAAPNGQLVFDAMKLADKGHGVLLLTLNYAGDQLAGKQAIKLAKKAGLNFRQVVTGEEIQYDPNGEDNKRGLAGAVALYHIAAAAAREGKSLDEVADIVQRYADSMASVTVKSTDATHPQNGTNCSQIAFPMNVANALQLSIHIESNSGISQIPCQSNVIPLTWQQQFLFTGFREFTECTLYLQLLIREV